MKRLLWIGDAVCETGFAKCTHETLEGLRQKYEVSVLGLNYRGDPHPYPYGIYPAWAGGDMFGVGRIKDVMRRVKPHVVVIQNDPWNIPVYLQAIENLDIKDAPRPVLVGAIAVDGGNCRGWALNGLDHVIFWTKYAEFEAIKGGLVKPSTVIPLGVDLDVFSPGDRLQALREVVQLSERDVPDGTFIVGNVNRNQPRKRLDLTIRYFAEWIKEYDVRDAMLFLHVAPTGDLGYDCDQLMGYYGLQGKTILAEPPVFRGVPEEYVVATLRCFSVQVNTGVGEGWGLPTMEGMACGIPQIAGRWSALGEWAKDAAYLVGCEPVCSLNKINTIGGEVRRQEFIEALDAMYRDESLREMCRTRGLELVNRDEYRWSNIAERFTREVDTAFDLHG
jgi:glycosyltransferase involved in cell wall biosynthesis